MPVEVQGTLDLSGILYDGRIKEDGDLTVSVAPFYYDMSGVKGYYIGSVGNPILDGYTNYIYFDDSLDLIINLEYPALGTPHIRLGRVIASGGFIVRIISDRALFTDASASSGSVPDTRIIGSGAGLTGGGNLTIDRTLSVVANADGSIVVNADDIQVGVLANDVQHGERGGGELHDVATLSVAGFMTGTDKAKLDGIAAGATNTPLASTAPENVTKSAAVIGVGTTVARADHKHDISTATAGAQVPGDTVLEGVATSLSRSDHRHSLPAFGTTSGTFAQGNDSRLSDDRTASGLRSLTTIVSISGATAPVLGQALVATSPTTATWQTVSPHGDFANGGDVAGANRTLGNTDSYDLAFITNNLTRLTITAGGNVTAAGRLASSTYVLGSDLSLQPVVGGQSVLTSWWGLQLVGNKQSTVEYTPSNYGAAGAYGVIIPSQQTSAVSLMVRGIISQTANLQNWESSAGTALAAIDVNGNIVFNSTQTVDGRDLSVDGSKLDGIAAGATNTPLASTAPANVTKAAAAVGVGTTAARADHKHDITTAAASSIGTANAEGSATSLARSDHVHAGLTRGANDFSTFTAKTALVDADLLLIEDSAAAGVKKKVQYIDIKASTITVQDEGVPVTATPHSTLNFVGAGVTATNSGSGVATITIPGGSTVFGTEWQATTLGTTTTTTATDWTSYLTLTTGTLPAGTYRVGFRYNWYYTSIAQDYIGRLFLDGATQIYYHREEPADGGTDQRMNEGGFVYVTFGTATTHTIEYQFASSAAGNTAATTSCDLEIWRVS